jgi:hypothetical protein
MEFDNYDQPVSTPELLIGKRTSNLNLSNDEIFNHASGMGQNPMRQSGWKTIEKQGEK